MAKGGTKSEAKEAAKERKEERKEKREELTAKLDALLDAVAAGQPTGEFVKVDAEEAKAALARGDIKPLDDAISAAEAATSGQRLRVTLMKDAAGSYVYVFLFLRPDGRYVDVVVDASDDTILLTRER